MKKFFLIAATVLISTAATKAQTATLLFTNNTPCDVEVTVTPLGPGCTPIAAPTTVTINTTNSFTFSSFDPTITDFTLDVTVDPFGAPVVVNPLPAPRIRVNHSLTPCPGIVGFGQSITHPCAPTGGWLISPNTAVPWPNVEYSIN